VIRSSGRGRQAGLETRPTNAAR